MLPSRISKRRGARPTQLNCTQAVRTHACHIVVPTRELVRAWSSARPCQRPPARDTPVARAARGHEHVRSFNQARSVCFNARAAAMVVLKRVSLSHTSYAARNVGLCHAFGMRHAYALALDVSLRRFAAVHAVTCILRGPWLFARVCGARIYQSKACENAKRVVAIA